MQELTFSFASQSLVPPVATMSPRPRLGLWSRLVPTAKCMDRSGNDKEKVVVVMGATGVGKSRLSVDLATRFSGEIINSDKMQVYKGLEVTTNQSSIDERCGVPHHLLGEFPPEDGEVTAADFRSLASQSISEIVSRGNLPIIAGGSNSFTYALLANEFDPKVDPFFLPSISSELRYECCFLWVDVSIPILFQNHSKRVDKMMELGMFKELAEFYVLADSKARSGIGKSIGVPEFDRFFNVYPPEKNQMKMVDLDRERKAVYEEAVKEIKENTWKLAMKQIEKIMKLKSHGWEIQRLDATKALMASSDEQKREIWENGIFKESVEIVDRFLEKK